MQFTCGELVALCNSWLVSLSTTLHLYSLQNFQFYPSLKQMRIETFQVIQCECSVKLTRIPLSMCDTFLTSMH